MSVTLTDFLNSVLKDPIALLTTVFVLGVIFVNGWTDAPNAIATCVSTRAIKPKKAVMMAAFFNFLGVFVMTMINKSVAVTVCRMVDFGSNANEAIKGLCAALIAIIAWSVLAWAFGIPTSESHALIAGLSGAAIAMHGSVSGINGYEWMRVIWGLLLSTVLGFITGFVISKRIQILCSHIDRRKTAPFFKNAQIFGGAAMSFMHGAQDGQKFMGVFLLGIFLVSGKTGVTEFDIPLWLMVLCSLVMALGTGVGGYKIIKSVGMDMVKPEPYQGFSADLSAAGCLLLASLTGLPVSTTHTKTTAIMGAGAAKRISTVNWKFARDMALAWILTFPGCGFLGFAAVKILFFKF